MRGKPSYGNGNLLFRYLKCISHHNTESISILPVISAILFLSFSVPAFATSISFDSEPYTLNDKGIITVDDSSNPAFTSNDKIDTVSVTVASQDAFGSALDDITLSLRETGPNTGMFKNTALIFSTNKAQFPQNSIIAINQNETDGALMPISCLGGSIVSSDKIDKICVHITSTTDSALGGSGITSFPLIETGNDTQVFVGKFTLTTGSTSNTAIKVQGGDILSVGYLGEFANALVTSNPNPGVGVILAAICPDPYTYPCDTITATYGSVSTSGTIMPGSGGGGGGGGLIRPGLVLDSIISLVTGGSPYIVSPPSFGGSYYHYSDGLTFAQGDTKAIFDTSKYNQELPRQVMVTGQQANMTFKTFESYNPEGVVHMGLYVIPRGADMITSNSLASIVWEKGKSVEVNDPNNVLSNATASSDSDGKFQYTKFSFVPTKSYDKMSFLARAWNDHLYSADIRVHDDVDPKPTISYEKPYWLHVYDNLHDADTGVEGAGFAKPHIFSHVSTSDQVWNQNGGTVLWFWDTKDEAVAMEAFDSNKNVVWIQSELLSKDAPQITQGPGASYAGNHLNRQDTTALENAQKAEQDRVDTTLQMLGYPVYWNHK